MNRSVFEEESKPRLLLIDLFKLFSIISIVFFHFNEFIFDDDFNPLRPKTIFFNYIGYFCEYTSFSGQTIVAISSFLFGLYSFRSHTYLLKIIGLFLFGYVAVNVSYYSTDVFLKFYWDVYPFLAISYFSLVLIKKNRVVIFLTAVSGFFMLIYPYQSLSQIPEETSILREIFYGTCTNKSQSSWPLFPWIGLVWMFFGLGSWIHFNFEIQQKLKSLSRREIIFIGLIFLSTLPSYRYFAGAPYGASLYCFVLAAPFSVTWAYLIFILLVIRLSFVNRVNQFCTDVTVLRILSRSAWARHFGPSYIFHIFYLGLLGYFQSFIERNPVYFDAALLSVFVAVECFGLLLSYLQNVKKIV